MKNPKMTRIGKDSTVETSIAKLKDEFREMRVTMDTLIYHNQMLVEIIRSEKSRRRTSLSRLT